MSTEDQPVVPATPSPAPAEHPANPLRDHSLEVQEVPEVLVFLRRNGASILIGVAVAIALFLGTSAYRNYRVSSREKASAALFSARSTEDLQKILSGYKSTPAAPLAQLSLAARHFDEGQYDMAKHEYAEFLVNSPDHPLRALAELGQAQCLEAGGQLQEALEAFQAFAKKYPDHFLAPMAGFGQARCFEQMGRFADAKAFYEDFIAAHPKDPWADRAESALLFVNKQMRAGGSASAAAPAP